jgi:hypothetical protein
LGEERVSAVAAPEVLGKGGTRGTNVLLINHIPNIMTILNSLGLNSDGIRTELTVIICTLTPLVLVQQLAPTIWTLTFLQVITFSLLVVRVFI